MSTSKSNPKPRLRRIVWPLAAFIALAGIWTGVWMSISAEVNRQLDQWLAQEAAVGRRHSCPERGIGGFPFRIDVICQSPVLQMHTPTGPVEAHFSGLRVAALIYRPRHVIADFLPPLMVKRGANLFAFVDFNAAQASLSLRDKGFERFSMVIDRPVFARSDNGRPDASARNLEIHLRPNTENVGQRQDFDIAVDVQGFGPAGVRPEQGGNIVMTAAARGLPNAAVEDGSGILAAWARAGGLFELSNLKVTRGSGILGVNGRLGFNERGFAQGQFEATIADSAALLGGIDIPGFGDLSLVFGPALTLVGRSGEIEGRRGTKVNVRVDNGVLSVGAVQIAEFPPAF